MTGTNDIHHGQSWRKRDVPGTISVAAAGRSHWSAATGTAALDVTGVTAVTFNDVTINATAGDVDVTAFEATTATATTSVMGLLGQAAPPVSISVGGTGPTSITANNVTLDASATSSYTYSAPLGGVLNAMGVAAAIADLEPSAAVTVEGSSTSATSINVNGADNT